MKRKQQARPIRFDEPAVQMHDDVEAHEDGSFTAVLRFGRFETEAQARMVVEYMLDVVSEDLDGGGVPSDLGDH